MIKFDDLIQVIASHQAIYVINKSYENKGDVDFCSANTEKIGGIRDCIYITIQNPKDFDC